MGLEGIDGGDIDDPASNLAVERLGPHVGHRRRHHVVSPAHIDLPVEIPILVGDVENRPARIDPGAIDETVDPAELACSFLEECARLCFGHDISGEAMRRHGL